MLASFTAFLYSVSAGEFAKFVWIILSSVFFISAIVILYKAHNSPRYPKFNLIDMFIDDGTQKTSSSKFQLIVAFGIATWIMIYLTLFNMMNPEYLTIYIASFVFNRYINKANVPPNT